MLKDYSGCSVVNILYGGAGDRRETRAITVIQWEISVAGPTVVIKKRA